MTQGKQLKDMMSRIIRAAQVIKRNAYDIDKDNKNARDAEVQMSSLLILVGMAAEIFAAREVIVVEEQSLTLDLEGEEEDGGSSDFSVSSAGFGGWGAAGDAALLPPPPPSPPATP